MSRVSSTTIVSAGHDRAAAAFRAVRAQPGWVRRLAALVALIVVGLPILALVLLAAIVAVVVLAVRALRDALVRWVGGLLPRRDGRANVRVIERGER